MYKKFALYVLLACTLFACKKENDVYDPYYNWQSRNAEWFAQAADTARREIAMAKAQYPNGNDWEAHCNWRMYKSLMRSPNVPGALNDSIVCKIIKRGYGDFKPTFTDSVRMHFRGWLMPTEYEEANGSKETSMTVFTQTYYGDFDPRIAAPQLMYVGGTVEGYQLALQNMVEGDDWMVYIPAKLAYNDESSSAIPAYSTLLYRMYVVGVYKSGSGATKWK